MRSELHLGQRRLDAKLEAKVSGQLELLEWQCCILDSWNSLCKWRCQRELETHNIRMHNIPKLASVPAAPHSNSGISELSKRTRGVKAPLFMMESRQVLRVAEEFPNECQMDGKEKSKCRTKIRHRGDSFLNDFWIRVVHCLDKCRNALVLPYLVAIFKKNRCDAVKSM